MRYSIFLPTGFGQEFAGIPDPVEAYEALTRLARAGPGTPTARACVPSGADFAYPDDPGSYGLVGTVETVRRRIAAYEAAGVQELIVGFEDPLDVDQVRRFAAEFMD